MNSAMGQEEASWERVREPPPYPAPHTLACALRTLSWRVCLVMVATPVCGWVGLTAPFPEGQHGHLVCCSQALDCQSPVTSQRAVSQQANSYLLARVSRGSTLWVLLPHFPNQDFPKATHSALLCRGCHVAPQYGTDKSLKHPGSATGSLVAESCVTACPAQEPSLALGPAQSWQSFGSVSKWVGARRCSHLTFLPEIGP